MVSRRAILGLLIGGGGGAAAFTQLGNDNGTDAPATNQQSGLVADDSSSPTPTRSSTPTTTEADGSNVETLTPRDQSPTPTEQSTETATATQTPTETATQAPTETATETAVSTATPVDAISRTAWMSDTLGRVDFILKNNFSDAEFVEWGRTTQTDDGTVYPTLRTRVTQETPKLAARAELQGDFSRVDRYTRPLSGLHVVTRLDSGETTNLRPGFEPVDGLQRVIFAIDDSKRIQSPTPTPTPTDSGFL